MHILIQNLLSVITMAGAVGLMWLSPADASPLLDGARDSQLFHRRWKVHFWHFA